jgi:hypothetical protein
VPEGILRGLLPGLRGSRLRCVVVGNPGSGTTYKTERGKKVTELITAKGRQNR